MRSWSSLLARVEMRGKTPDDDERIDEFVQEVVIPGHHVISYDPSKEVILVLSADACDHLMELVDDHACNLCTRMKAQLQVQKSRLGQEGIEYFEDEE
ncbi:MAG: hypothetical protein C4318_06665 [Acidimicrobiia bacterium]